MSEKTSAEIVDAALVEVEAVKERGRRQLQEVYRHLDGVGGDRRIAWYGQLRAEEYSHEEALRMTVEHFHLEREPWYQLRFKENS